MFNWFKKKFTNDKTKETENEKDIEQLIEDDVKLEDIHCEVAQEECDIENFETASLGEEQRFNANESDKIFGEITVSSYSDSDNLNKALLTNESDQKVKLEEAETDLTVESSSITEEYAEPKKKTGFWNKIVSGLEKTRKEVVYKFEQVLGAYDEINDELFDDLEEVLITSDMGVETTMIIIDRLKKRAKDLRLTNPIDVRNLLKDEIKNIILENKMDYRLNIEPSPSVILVVGVNGVGKTTMIGKLSNNLKKQGKSVLIAAADTFRAAAIEQLEEWAKRAGVDCIRHREGSDPAAVIFDGIQAAKARNIDVLICDTAGRLHNKANLMNELAKIFKVMDREYSNAKREVLLVLDATTGQNALVQAKTFSETVKLTGIVLTKLDGTAKGGVVVSLQRELGIPVKLVGLGEGIDDLQEFIPEAFAEGIF